MASSLRTVNRAGCTVTWRGSSSATRREASRVSDTVWITYDELADRLRIGRESARRLVLRKRWAKRKGNDGKVRIGVPGEALSRDDPRHATRLDAGQSAGHDAGGVTPDVTRQAQPDPVLQVKIRELERFRVRRTHILNWQCSSDIRRAQSRRAGCRWSPKEQSEFLQPPS